MVSRDGNETRRMSQSGFIISSLVPTLLGMSHFLRTPIILATKPARAYATGIAQWMLLRPTPFAVRLAYNAGADRRHAAKGG